MSLDKSVKKDKNVRNAKTEVVNMIANKENNVSKVKLIIEAFEKNVKCGQDAKNEKDIIEVNKTVKRKKDAFKVLMESSKKLGGRTPSPSRKHPRKKMIGQRNNMEKN